MLLDSFLRRAAAAAAAADTAKMKKKDGNTDTTMALETKKEENVVCGETVKYYLDALCTQLANRYMNWRLPFWRIL